MGASTETDQKIKVAVAVGLHKLKMYSRQKPPTTTTTTNSSSSSHLTVSDAHRWKRKAKERKQELIKLKQELKDLEDGSPHDLFPPSACCKCYFFDNLGRSDRNNSSSLNDESDRRVNDVLHRRFLRQVRLKEKRRRSDESVRRRYDFDLNVDYETEQLTTSVDFLVELCKTMNNVENRTCFANMSHQAVDFILVSLRKFAKESKRGCVEGIVNSLITRLVGRMCTSLPSDESPLSDFDAQFCVQHLLRKLGTDAYIGQRIMLAISQRILVLADNLLFMDPFDDTFPTAHSCMFLFYSGNCKTMIKQSPIKAIIPLYNIEDPVMLQIIKEGYILNKFDVSHRIQLVEFLVSDYIQSWTSNDAFETLLFEEWLRSVIQARKALCLLESRNALYVVYMDRVTGELAKQVRQVSCLLTLNPDILESLSIPVNQCIPSNQT